jgi:plastocyanin
MKSPLVPLAFIALASGCTNGGVLATNGGGAANVTGVTKIDVSLSAFPSQSTPAGPALGFSPEVTTVSVGSGVQFVNVDNTSHTATAIPGATTFPAVTPFTLSATSASATTNLSSGWSSGTLPAGSSSQIFLVDQSGEYLYGCFFHYSGGMRGVIVAQ